MRLYQIAHARAGDKGDTSILLLAPFDPADFQRLREHVTASRVSEHFGSKPENVSITVLELLCAITIVIREQLAGGVTRTHRIDPHGKTLASHLLDLEIG